MTGRRGPDTGRRAPTAAVVMAVLVVGVLAAACGGGSGGDSVEVVAGASSETQAGAPQAEAVSVRLAVAPDPVWQSMQDSGVVMAGEIAGNIRIDASNPFDPFSALAAGQADAAVVNALDVPPFLSNSGRDLAVIGKVSTDRSYVAVNRTTRAQTLDDLIEKKIAVASALGSTLLWGAIADHLHDLEFKVASPDFELVVVDASNAADLVMRGDVDACVCVPDFTAQMLSEGLLRPLYDGRSAAEVYATDVLGDPSALLIGEALVVEKQWYDQNPQAAASLLAMWDQGLQNWVDDRPNHVRQYPHLLSIESDEEIEWIIDYLEQHDWTASSAPLTAEDAKRYSDILARLRDSGLIDADDEDPEVVVSAPAGQAEG